jgi:hypothetical protein
MNRWVLISIVLAVVASLGVVYHEVTTAAEDEAWTALAAARTGVPTADGLESARETANGTTAEAWASFDLAFFLYSQDTNAERQRALQVARQAISSHPDHAASGLLRELIEVLETYPTN